MRRRILRKGEIWYCWDVLETDHWNTTLLDSRISPDEYMKDYSKVLLSGGKSSFRLLGKKIHLWSN